jgi:hypothetical protein
MRKSNRNDQEKWDALLESEGLGIIEVDGPYKGTDLKQIKGKWARLDAEINELQSPSEVMTNSPPTVKAVATRAASVQRGQPRDFTSDGSQDVEDSGENVWDCMALSVTASPKEAEIADRRRAAVAGLDKWGRPLGLKTKRVPGESKAAWRQRNHDRIIGEGLAKGPGPLLSDWQPPMPPYAHTDAGNGPLSIKDQPGPDFGSAPRIDEPVRMSPVVDTMTYPPGRGPYQTSRYMATNSDITG